MGAGGIRLLFDLGEVEEGGMFEGTLGDILATPSVADGIKVPIRTNLNGNFSRLVFSRHYKAQVL